ncbi:MAG: type II secretion system minor pseudopilin GspK [Burkholderiaceae bacterium]|nr:type II secretion system minor pseudopilin GspK [Burkholderiaceae bacterium]
MRRARNNRRKNQRGVAVITALLLTTLAITIVASLFWQQQVQVRSIENQRLQLQKLWILRGALDYARLVLREDARNSTVDHLGEPWAVPLEETRLDQFVDNNRSEEEASEATLSGNIVDAQSRYNLTNLCVGGAIDPNQVSTFGRLLTNLSLPPSLAQATANFMQTAQKNSGQTQQAAAAAAAQASAAATVANANVNGSTTAGTAPITGALPSAEGGGSTEPLGLTQRDDLLAVQGFTPDMVAKLKDYVVVLPTPTPVNVNTAPAEVISAIIPNLALAEANSIIARRTYYNTVADFASNLGGKAATLGNNAADVKTNYFLVNGKVRLSRAALDVQSLIQRNGTNTAIIWTRQN